MSGHVPTVLPVQSDTTRTDNSYYVNLSDPEDSPEHAPPAAADVRTPDVRTPGPLPHETLDSLLQPYRVTPRGVARLLAGRRERAEHQHAPAPAEPQTLEDLAIRIRPRSAPPKARPRWTPTIVVEDGTVRIEWPDVLHEALDGWEITARMSPYPSARDLERIAAIRAAIDTLRGVR